MLPESFRSSISDTSEFTPDEMRRRALRAADRLLIQHEAVEAGKLPPTFDIKYHPNACSVF